jgi:hypothetical protein
MNKQGAIISTRPDSRKAREILRKIRDAGPDPRLRGLSEAEVMRRIKKTREAIWREKIAGRS